MQDGLAPTLDLLFHEIAGLVHVHTLREPMIVKMSEATVAESRHR